MPKIAIANVADAPLVGPPPGFAGEAETRAVFDQATDPLHVHQHRLAKGAALRIGPLAYDLVAYVWRGGVEAGGRRLAETSSLVVERGASVEILGQEAESLLMTFHAARPAADGRTGGHVHLLPTEQVPRGHVTPAGTPRVGGGMHANADCPTCHIWLHENHLPPHEDTRMVGGDKGVHSHSEDEVIFVIEGEMHLGARRLGPGSALAIAARTFYGFGVGPQGLSFINFRGALPDDIRFKTGGSMDEVGYWREQVGAPQYLEPLPA